MLEFRILGPVEVVWDGRPVSLGGSRQRALLTDLVVHADEVVPADRLIDDLWAGEAPDSASHGLHVYVSRLRKAIGDERSEILVTRAPGYTLRIVPPNTTDASAFELALRQGAERLVADPAWVLTTIDAALAMWRGRALEEFADLPFAQPSATRLEGMRETASQLRVEALLELGRHEHAVADLEGLIVRYPLRERLRELYMLGLYRMGRQADALDAARSARRALSEELGVDPGPGLAALEQAILRHDPELMAPDRPQIVSPVDPRSPPAGETPSTVRGRDAPRADETAGAGDRAVDPGSGLPSSRRTRRPLLVLLGGAGLVAIVVAAIVVPRSDDPRRGAGPASPSSRAVAGSRTGERTWVEVPDADRRLFGGPGDQLILGGVASPEGVIAVGYSASPRVDPGSERDYDAALWMLGP